MSEFNYKKVRFESIFIDVNCVKAIEYVYRKGYTEEEVVAVFNSFSKNIDPLGIIRSGEKIK